MVLVLGAQTVRARSFAIRIPAEPIPQALVDLAIQTELSVSDTGVDFGAANTRAVFGTYTPEQALSRMLAGTPFAFRFVDPTTVQVYRPDSVTPSLRGPATTIPEIVVVTATKRREVAAELPYSFTVVTAQQLASERSRTVTDLSTDVAQLTETNLGAGEDKIFLRGLTDSIVPGLSESVVGVYLDDVRIGDDEPDPDLELVDVDRVEVLNGPQGTLYGSGSLGGLVRIVTHQPEMDQIEAAASASAAQTKYGGVSNSADAVVNLPLPDDDAALRLVAYERKDAGYIDEARLGIADANSTSIAGGRAALRWEPLATWSATLAFAYQHISAGDAQYLDAPATHFVRQDYLLQPHRESFLDGALTIDGDLGFADLVSATALVDRQHAEQFDASFVWPTLTGYPIGPSRFDDSRHIRSYTHESRLVSKPATHWKWLVGIFLAHKEEDFASTLAGPDASGNRIVPRSEHRDDMSNEAAVFGEMTYAFDNRLSVTAGVRAFDAWDNVKANIASIFGDAAAFRGSNNRPGLTPKLVLAYKLWPALLLYAQVTEGYRLGGLNVDGPVGAAMGDDNSFRSDVLWNYEIGAKTSLFNGIVVANGATYIDRWSNVQADQIGRDGSFFILNAGTVRNLGAEADVTVRPIQNLVLRGNFFWNNAELSHSNPLLVQTEGILPAVPRTKFGVTARYDLPIRSLDSFIAVEYGYVGKSHLGFDETAPTMGGYHIANIRAGIVLGKWEVQFFADNLQREDENTFGFGNPFDPNPQVTPPRPRTIGVSLDWHS
jgi:outer membrane receptor protein involved in Fe transport